MGGNVERGGAEIRAASHLNLCLYREKMNEVWEELKTGKEKLRSLEVGGMPTQEGRGQQLWSLMPFPD